MVSSHAHAYRTLPVLNLGESNQGYSPGASTKEDPHNRDFRKKIQIQTSSTTKYIQPSQIRSWLEIFFSVQMSETIHKGGSSLRARESTLNISLLLLKCKYPEPYIQNIRRGRARRPGAPRISLTGARRRTVKHLISDRRRTADGGCPAAHNAARPPPARPARPRRRGQLN
ncbi:hypothetical protein EVAR_79332_1 [Eumeta japonica]|uniref:Uncharacterized protein n=1 Tax=Eumeta variegata TaxID=151549 RepID=A0A4C1TER2_EUMVA|nr:hypothetical protein EVAR_79332_1 [Eumeta japonica]